MQIVGTRHVVSDESWRAGHPREFPDVMATAFVEAEGNYIARQNRDHEARYGFRTGKTREVKGERGKNVYAFHSFERALFHRYDSLEIFCDKSRVFSVPNGRGMTYNAYASYIM